MLSVRRAILMMVHGLSVRCVHTIINYCQRTTRCRFFFRDATLRYVSCLRSPWGDVRFKLKYRTNTEYLNSTQIWCFKGFHLRRNSPQGDLKQETYSQTSCPILSNCFVSKELVILLFGEAPRCPLLFEGLTYLTIIVMCWLCLSPLHSECYDRSRVSKWCV